MTTNKDEYVYIISNPSFTDDTLKIGWTRNHPIIRANDLNTTGLPTPFVVEAVIITQEGEGSNLERRIHAHIKEYRLNSNREFFKISKDFLIEKLTNELNLEIVLIDDVIIPINTKIKIHKSKKVNEIINLYETLKKESEEFFRKLERANTELVIKVINNKKHIIIIESDYNQSGEIYFDWWNDEGSNIRSVCYFIKQDIEIYKEWVNDLINKYEEIKKDIGVLQLRADNKSTKNMILDTQKKLDNLKSEYIWEL